LGNQLCTICLDTVKGLEYIEVEGTQNQVELWEKRLNLKNKMDKSYHQLCFRDEYSIRPQEH